MANVKKSIPGNTAEQVGSLPARITVPEFHAAVSGVFLHYLRTLAMLTSEKAAWGITGAPGSGQRLADASSTADSLGLTYEYVGRIPFARAMERLYEFAYFAKWDESSSGMGHTGDYTFIAAIVADARPSGTLVDEWKDHGISIDTVSAEKCSEIVELANARNILEGGECFIHGGQEGRLTVPQMALLAGMEEMSIRAAANPQRTNALVTIKDSGTFVAVDVARKWLQSKGRYIPVTRYWSEGEIDLTQRRFTDAGNLIEALSTRREMLAGRQGTEKINERFIDLGIGLRLRGLDHIVLDIQEDQLRNEDLMRAVAEVLEMPGDLLVLRSKEMLALQQLSQIECQLREATLARTGSVK